MSFYHEVIRIANKRHTCQWCREYINRKEPYQLAEFGDGGTFGKYKMHIECYHAFDASCRSISFRAAWEEGAIGKQPRGRRCEDFFHQDCAICHKDIGSVDKACICDKCMEKEEKRKAKEIKKTLCCLCNQQIEKDSEHICKICVDRVRVEKMTVIDSVKKSRSMPKLKATEDGQCTICGKSLKGEQNNVMCSICLTKYLEELIGKLSKAMKEKLGIEITGYVMTHKR